MASTGDLWDALRPDPSADEFETETQPVPLASKSDAVAVGRFDATCPSRTMQGDPNVEIDVIEMKCLELTVTDVLSGSLPSDRVSVEFLFGPRDISEEDLPDAEVVVFLVEGGGDAKGLYAATNTAGIWSSTSRAEVDWPLKPSPPNLPSINVGGPVPEATEWETFVASLEAELAATEAGRRS